MTKKQRAAAAVERLEKKYPDAVCSLKYTSAFQLLIATRLSAQCTDARVNIVTPALFKKYPDSAAMAKAKLCDVEELIKSCGLYKTKAKDLIGIAKGIEENFGGKVPDSIEELTTLPGVGRKTANLVCGDIYGQDAVVTDTHFIRIMNRLGLVSTSVPFAVEKQMRDILPTGKMSDFCHRTVLHGRDTCTARRAFCEKCILNDVCLKKGINKDGTKKNSRNS